MGKRLFGTDGIRGVAGEPPLDAATVIALGIALGDDLTKQGLAGAPVLIGMDTRESGPAIAAQLAEGLRRSGFGVRFAGVVTTPGVAYLARTGDFAAGVMISASHNPFQDNGLRVFARTGYKLPDADEHEIEEEIFRILPELRTGEALAVLAVDFDVRPLHLTFLLGTIERPLHGLRLIVDCGNGAASVGADLFRGGPQLKLSPSSISPHGRNINLNCGALHVEALREKVMENRRGRGNRVRRRCRPRNAHLAAGTPHRRRCHHADRRAAPAGAGSAQRQCRGFQ